MYMPKGNEGQPIGTTLKWPEKAMPQVHQPGTSLGDAAPKTKTEIAAYNRVAILSDGDFDPIPDRDENLE